jgi:hypothetical protein
MKNRYRPHFIAIALYTLLAMGLTWPLMAYLPTHIPGEATWAFDESTFVWNMWWLKQSVLALGQSPLHTGYTFFPLGIDLTTYTFNLFNAAFGLPLQLGLSLPLASNLTLLFSYISSAYGMFLFSRYLLPRRPRSIAPDVAAFVAGAGFAFSASRMMYVALGHYNFVTIQWFPFYTLFLLKMLRRGRLKDGRLAGIFAALCLYAELTYSVFLLFLTVFVFIAEAVARPKAIARQIPALGMLIATAFILTAPFILAVLPNFLDPAYGEPGWGEGLKLSADLTGLFTLTPLHPLSGVEWQTELRAVIAGTSRFSDANTLFLGYGVLALALLGFLAHRKNTRVWFWAAVSFTILSLGPLLTINGQNRFNLDGLDVTFPLPFALLHYLPVLSANRVPNRFAIPLTLSLAVLVGFGVMWLLEKLARRGRWAIPLLATLLLVVLLFDQFSAPLPLTDARIPDVYRRIGAEPGDFTLMQLPLGWRNSYGTLGAERTQLQYYQSAHHRPMLGGNTSRNPAFKFDYFANIPLFYALTETELYRPVDDPVRERASQQAAELMTLYNIKYLVVHEPLPRRLPYLDTYPATRALALALIPHQPEPVYQSPGVEAFAVLPAPIPNPLTIDFGDWRSDPYRGAGWAGNETVFAATANWATALTAEVFFPYHGPGPRRLSLQVAPFSYPNAPAQQLSLRLNGQPFPDNYSLRENWQIVEAVLPEAALTEGLNRLTLQFAHTAAPREVLPAQRAIGDTGREAPTDVEVNSGADFAFITVGFDDAAVDASAHRRGLNVAIIDAQTGAVLDFRGFDTAANDYEAEALRQFIEPIPAGQIVVIATQGPDAAAHLTPEAVAALESVGLSAASLTPPFSAIGVKGAQPDAALQSTGEGAAYLRLGPSPDTRPLAAAVDFISIAVP